MVGGTEIALWILLLASCATDLICGKIFNAITVPFALVGLSLRLYRTGSDGLLTAALAIAVAFVLFYPLYLLKVFGAADVKLLMAVGAWSDARAVIFLGISAILIGATVGVVVLWKKSGARGGFQSVLQHLRLRPERSVRMPFAPAFLCGFLFLRIAEMNQWLCR